MPGQIINRSTGKSPTYQVRVPLGRDQSGKRIYLNKTIHGTKREAELFLADQLRKRDLGEELATARQPATMAELFQDTLSDSELHGKPTVWIEQKLR